ncbi:hypothetical protein OG369_43400 [Streptomyces sp. NBC_01221]|uniref:hypothetical protein n=1 Tax=Streptomyces sp. NBC_01221 TaxID=2903782 RepID=UPI002250D210|nr:hypothetical protein [Streptomyces sp. NBC_01221]MCX4792625.1 hypothetical protein [Streptomyces sp. NBC_01221]
MPKQNPSTSSCVEHGLSGTTRRLNGAEAIVIIVVVCITAALTTFGDVPSLDVLQLLAGAGLIAGTTIALSTRFSFQAVRTVLKAALTAA